MASTFKFGSTPAPAGAPPAPAFTFGATAAAPQPAPSTTTKAGAFSFGAQPTAPKTPVPSFGGFGGGTPAPATATTAPAPTTGFGGFGLANAAASTPAPFSFGGINPNTNLVGSGNNSNLANVETGGASSRLEIPSFSAEFPYLKIKAKLNQLLSTNGWQREELMNLLQCGDAASSSNEVAFGNLLVNPTPLTFTFRNDAVRRELETKPVVMLQGKGEAALNNDILRMVGKIADDLRVSEKQALTLFAEASIRETREWLEDSLNHVSFVGQALKDDGVSMEHMVLGNDIVKTAQELYFHERGALLEGLRSLCQSRLENEPSVVTASDQLLQNNLIPNLITFIRTSTERILELRQELKRPLHVATPGSVSDKEKPSFAKVLKKFLLDQRQLAAECLFYLTYQTQCTPAEVVALIDLVRDLTNGLSDQDQGLPVLDYRRDVPDPYEPDPPTFQIGHTLTQPLPPKKEKSVGVWRAELVEMVWKSDQPQLMQCVGVLVAAVICSIDARNQLLDRRTHQLGSVGNTLYQPDSPASATTVMPIHERLDANNTQCRSAWKNRQDIWGLFAAAYALLLRPPPIAGVTSPRSPRASGAIDSKKTWKKCLQAPQECKSFSFCRWTWVPCFHVEQRAVSKSNCDLREFLLSVATEFTVHYMNVVTDARLLPASRLRWQVYEEEQLAIKRDQREQSQRFGQQYGFVPVQEEVPKLVDLLQRPDCSNDIVAWVVSLCVSGPEYANKFWEVNESGDLMKNRLLIRLEDLARDDQSLLASYAYLLGAVCIADQENGAAAQLVYDDLFSESNLLLDWKVLLRTIRYYSSELSQTESTPQTSESGRFTPGTPGKQNTAYYYGVDGNGYDGTSDRTTKAVASGVTKSTKPREIDEADLSILLSHLSLIMRVACRSAKARAGLVGMNVHGVDTSMSDEQSILVTLFTLAISAVTPEIRGTVLSTVASLLRTDGATEAERQIIVDMARKAWDLLELTNLLPVTMLSQFRTFSDQEIPQMVRFPPSSLSVVAPSGVTGNLLPPDPKLGIVFEMEYIESRNGTYPSTEGMLKLIAALVSSAGCPPDLGSSSGIGQAARAQTGCAPYLEYITGFVLEKISNPSTPFKREVDKRRLAAIAYEVIGNVLSRYAIPSLARDGSPVPLLEEDMKKQKDAIRTASAVLQMPSLARKVVQAPMEEDLVGYRRDFQKAGGTKLFDSAETSNPSQRNQVILPQAKSPAFVILAEVLAIHNDGLFSMLCDSISSDGADIGIGASSSILQQRDDCAFALFGSFEPSIGSARGRTTTLNPLQPSVISESMASDIYDDAVSWRELVIAHALKILCAVAAREKPFIKATRGRVQVLPVLSFRKNRRAINSRSDYQLVQLKDKFELASHLLPAVTRFIGYLSSDQNRDADLSTSALALGAHACEALTVEQSMRLLCGPNSGSEALFAAMVGRRLEWSATHADTATGHADSVKLILRLLHDKDLSRVLFGFSQLKSPNQESTKDCLQTIQKLLREGAFVSDPATAQLASSFYELIHYTISEATNKESAHVVQLQRRLRSDSFWELNIERFWGGASGQPPLLLRHAEDSTRVHIVTSMGWFTQALAEQMNFILHTKETSPQEVYDQTLAMLHLFLSNSRMCQAFDTLPVWAKEVDFPSSLRYLGDARMQYMVPSKSINPHSRGYMLVDKLRLEKAIKAHPVSDPSLMQGLITLATNWASEWNDLVNCNHASDHLSMSLSMLLYVCISGLYSSVSEFILEAEIQLLDLLKLLCEQIGELVAISTAQGVVLNLSICVLLLVDTLVDLSGQPTRDSSGTLLSLLISATSKASSDVQSVEGRNTSVFLILMLCVARFLDIKSQDISNRVVDAFEVLCGPLSILGGGVGRGEETGQAAATLISRGTLNILLEIVVLSGEDPISNEMIMRREIGRLVESVEPGDESLSCLLGRIAMSKSGAQMLVENGILEAFPRAFQTWRTWEATKRGELALGDVRDAQNVPDFIRGHLSILSSFLSFPELHGLAMEKVLVSSTELLARYKDVLERAFSQFPSSGETWMELCQFLALIASRIKEEPALNNGQSRIEIPSFLAEMIAKVALQLMKNPLPLRFLPIIPSRLREMKSVLPTSAESSQSWWEVIEKTLGSSEGALELSDPVLIPMGASTISWTNLKFDAARYGARILDYTLSVLIQQIRVSGLRRIDEVLLTTGVFTYLVTVQALKNRLREVEAAQRSFRNPLGMDIDDNRLMEKKLTTEKDYLTETIPIMTRCCEKVLLFVCLVQQSSVGDDNKLYRKNLDKAIKIVLDHTKVASFGLGSSDDYVSKIAMVLVQHSKE